MSTDWQLASVGTAADFRDVVAFSGRFVSFNATPELALKTVNGVGQHNLNQETTHEV